MSQFPSFANALLATVIGGVITAWLVMKFVFKKKLILYTILTEDSLINITDEDAKQRIQLRYLTTPNQHEIIRNLYLFKIKFCNAGDSKIDAADFDPPITVEFGKNSKILDARIEQCSPRNLPISLNWKLEQLELVLGGQSVSVNRIKVPPVALNPKESFLISALVTNPEKITVEGRVSEGKFVKKENHKLVHIRARDFLFIATLIYLIGEFFPSVKSTMSFLLYWVICTFWIFSIFSLLGWVEII